MISWMKFGIVLFPIIFSMILIGLLFFVFWITMLVDIATKKFKEGSEKIAWVLVIIFTNFLGALIYYFVVYKKHKSLRWFWITLLILFVILVVSAFILYFSRLGMPSY